MKKIHYQPSAWTNTPPANGPTKVATPPVAVQMANATPRRCGSNIRLMIDNVCGNSSEAPRPCTARAVISIPMLPDNPHHNDAAVNTARPMT